MMTRRFLRGISLVLVAMQVCGPVLAAPVGGLVTHGGAVIDTSAAGVTRIVQSTDLVPMGLSGRELTLLHHPTGSNTTRTPDWVVLAVPPTPVEWLYFDLLAAGVSVERVGDCVAPRRAHAAVVEGDRAGAAVGTHP